MQLLIFFKAEYKSTSEERARCFKQFRNDIKQWKFVKLLKELDERPPASLIEFPDNKKEEMYNNLRTLDIVETIDSIIPRDI